MQTNTTIELDDHGKLKMATQGNGTINLQKSSKKTERISKVCNSKINGIDEKNKTDGKSQTQGRRWGKKEITPPIDAGRDQAVLKKNKFTATRISQMSKKIIIGA